MAPAHLGHAHGRRARRLAVRAHAHGRHRPQVGHRRHHRQRRAAGQLQPASPLHALPQLRAAVHRRAQRHPRHQDQGRGRGRRPDLQYGRREPDVPPDAGGRGRLRHRHQLRRRRRGGQLLRRRHRTRSQPQHRGPGRGRGAAAAHCGREAGEGDRHDDCRLHAYRRVLGLCRPDRGHRHAHQGRVRKAHEGGLDRRSRPGV